jgi:hypothetical protein
LIFAIVAGIAGLLFLVNMQTALILLRRQALQDIDIPRAVRVASLDDGIWPIGEEVALRFHVYGLAQGDVRTGTVRIREKGDNGRAFSVPLTFEEGRSDGAVYVAKVPPGNVDFTYKAKVSDGRTRTRAEVQYVARPSVIDQKAYVKLHDYAGLSPAEAKEGVKTSFEQLHPRGRGCRPALSSSRKNRSSGRCWIFTARPIPI